MLYRQIGKCVFKATAAVVALGGSVELTAQNRPNIILIMTDQQTANAMSNRENTNLRTPAMDALAHDGITFTRAYCSYPLSGPSRASLVTGRMPVELGVNDNNDPIPENEIRNTIGIKMSEAGYDCLYAGKWHIPTVDIPDSIFGFRKVAGMNDMTLVSQVKSALQKRNDSKPVFLVASFLNPHEICEYARSQTLHYGGIEIPDDTVLPKLPENFQAVKGLPEGLMLHKQLVPKSYPTSLYTKEDWRHYLYTYDRLVERVDKLVGELTGVLKENDLYDNSLIIFLSDHGDGVAAHQWNQKRALFEETINIPLIVKVPEKEKQLIEKVNSEALVNIGLDVYPTICDYAGVKIPEDLSGQSLKKTLAGHQDTLHDAVFVETFLDGIMLRGWCVISGNYKYVLYQYYKNREQLFNLKTDKGEVHNLIGQKEYAPVRLGMRTKLLNYARKVKDPLLLKELR